MLERVLVTGGAGFLGSHLCDRLLAEGSEVVCLDNLVTGQAANVAALQGRAGFTFALHDITEPYRPPRPPTAVVHLACPASPAAYMARPIETLEVASAGTGNALDIAGEAGAVFLLSSTSEVYGDPEVHPQPEWYRGNVSTTGPRSVYDEGKRFAEALTTAYHRTHGVDVRIARIFNTYGPRLAAGDGRVVSNFVVQALSGDPITVYGDGSHTRSFCYVDDMVEGLLALLQRGGPEPVNLGNPDERTILSVAESVVQATGSPSPIVFERLPEDDPCRRQPDITRARERLGWSPVIPFEEGLSRTVQWFDSSRAAEVSPGLAV